MDMPDATSLKQRAALNAVVSTLMAEYPAMFKVIPISATPC